MPPERVLVITYLFPPSGGVGVPRFVSYARHLPKNGCEVFILAPKYPATPVFDYDLAKKVPPETKVYRAFNPEIPYSVRDGLWKKILAGQKNQAAPVAGSKPSPLKRLARGLIQSVFNPDVQVVWVPWAIRAARRIIARHGITAVILNLPPYSCLNIGVAVKRHFPNVKLILDFRDEWIENYLALFDTAAAQEKVRDALKLERSAVEAADLVAAVTPSQLAQIRHRYPQQPDSKFIYAPNGFDPDDWADFAPRPARDRMIVTNFGSVYANPSYRPIFDYLDIVDELPDAVRARIETRFIGRVAKEAAPLLENRRHKVTQYGFMTRGAAKPLLEETAYNLIPAANATVHGGRTFDYLGMGVPILAITVAGGDQEKLIQEAAIGYCADPRDRAAIRQMLLSAFDRWERGDLQGTSDRAAVRNYEWPNLVARFVKLTGLGAGREASKNE